MLNQAKVSTFIANVGQGHAIEYLVLWPCIVICIIFKSIIRALCMEKKEMTLNIQFILFVQR